MTEHPAHIEQFRTRPENYSGATMIVCSHPVHGVETFYLSIDDFQDEIKALLIPFWVNSYTITMIPMEM